MGKTPLMWRRKKPTGKTDLLCDPHVQVQGWPIYIDIQQIKIRDISQQNQYDILRLIVEWLDIVGK
jgi:hypothetical protein